MKCLTPAWNEIPQTPSHDDLLKQLAHCGSEAEELVEAVSEWEEHPTATTFAHMAEEACDNIVSNLTLLHLMERMKECPCGDSFAEDTMEFVYLKNKRRGYHD